MAPPNRDPSEDSLLEEEATRMVAGVSDAGAISFSTKFDFRLPSVRL